MITLFCLVVFGQFPHELGIPLYMIIISLIFDVLLMIKTDKHTIKGI